ncbi:MAG TPA: acyl-CoA dehydrogenase family protein, partial [Chitinophagaceae bacterium]|nr:acyl-CoA dehydrogenase family protein [Chitinophagaceae bacterium]
MSSNPYYFTEEHELFRQSLRQFLDAEAAPHIDRWEEEGKIDREFWKKFGQMGYFGLNMPEELGGSNADFFYNVVMLEEISKMYSGGFTITAAVQVFMSTPYILQHGTDYLKKKYLVPAIAGEMIGCIGITEPGAGSDAANIQTRAIRDGDYYIVNGSKTFITNGIYGDFVILVCKTNPEAGAAGVSLLVLDLNAEGVSKRKLKKLGWHASDTAELSFDDVKVPVANRLGEEGRGFYYLMGGLQLERLSGAIMAYAGCEAAIQYSLDYMSQRKAFGRTIDKFQVLRHRIAQLAAETEA